MGRTALKLSRLFLLFVLLAMPATALANDQATGRTGGMNIKLDPVGTSTVSGRIDFMASNDRQDASAPGAGVTYDGTGKVDVTLRLEDVPMTTGPGYAVVVGGGVCTNRSRSAEAVLMAGLMPNQRGMIIATEELDLWLPGLALIAAQPGPENLFVAVINVGARIEVACGNVISAR
ncbi:MAG: hypothetical protein HY329_05765 [Chloroflexi bacterium]|nr:hypothetical protein [Chloroflexota bacterium]